MIVKSNIKTIQGHTRPYKANAAIQYHNVSQKPIFSEFFERRSRSKVMTKQVVTYVLYICRSQTLPRRVSKPIRYALGSKRFSSLVATQASASTKQKRPLSRQTPDNISLNRLPSYIHTMHMVGSSIAGILSRHRVSQKLSQHHGLQIGLEI